MTAPAHRLADWLTARPRLVDGGWAVVLLPMVWASCLGAARDTGLALVWALAYVAPLVWRRARPDLAALAVVPAHLVQLAVDRVPQFGNVVVPIMLYAVAAYGREQYARAWLVAGWVASVVAAIQWSLGPTFAPPSTWPAVVFGAGVLFVGLAGITTAAWFMGSLARSRRAAHEMWRDRAEALERERDQRGRLAASEERQRIAREMHDIVAHSLSVIVVQADGGAYAAGMPGDAEARLRTAAQALETIKTTARSALGETRRLVGVLRADDPGADLAPSASLAEVPALVARLVEAGRRADLVVEGDPAHHPPLSAGAELAAFRVVQESLTNVMKHAGPDAAVSVRLVHSGGGLVITVRDTGPGATGDDGGGHGLVGMRERVAAYGGSLSTRNIPGGGFEVVAHLPAPPTKETP